MARVAASYRSSITWKSAGIASIAQLLLCRSLRPPRRYDASRRRAAAAATRHAILVVAREAFLERGYSGTTMPAIAERAGVALDTVYASVGRKPALFRELIETAISGQDEAVPAEQREYIKAMRAHPKAARKLEIYAAAAADEE